MPPKNWHDINSPGFGFVTEEELQRQQKEEQIQEELLHGDGDENSKQLKAEMYDPRWHHKDPKRAEETPDAVRFGDTIVIEIKTRGIVNGAGIDIEVIDNNSDAPWTTKRKLRTRVKNNTLTVEWTVEKGKNDCNEPHYGFSAAYSGCSGNASVRNTPIPLEKLEEIVFELSM